MMDDEKERILILHLKDDAEKMIRKIMGNDSKTTDTVLSDELSFSGLNIYLEQRRILYDNMEIQLNREEFNVLQSLVQRLGWVVTKEQILEAAGSEDPQDEDNAVRCLMAGICKKLRLYTEKEYIQKVHGVGYRFVIPPK